MFPFPPTPPLKPHDDEIKPTINNNNYEPNNNCIKDPKKFYLDTILGLKKEVSSPPPASSPPHSQDDPIDLSVKGRIRPKSREMLFERRKSVSEDEGHSEEEEDEQIDVVNGIPGDENKTIPLDLSV